MVNVINWMSLSTDERLQIDFQTIWWAPVRSHVTDARAFSGGNAAWNYMFPFFFPWCVQAQSLSVHTLATRGSLVLPVNAGGLVNGKWYMTGRLRTKSFLFWLTDTHTHTHPPSRLFHLRSTHLLRHAYLEFTSTCDSEQRAYSFRSASNTNGHKASHKSNDWLNV